MMDNKNNDERLADIQKALDYIEKKESFIQKYGFQILTLVFLAGGGWVSLENIDAIAQDNKTKIERSAEREQDIKQELTAIKVRQEVMKEDVSEIKDDLKETKETMQKILEEVKKRDNG